MSGQRHDAIGLKLLVGIAALLAVAAAYWLARSGGVLELILDGSALRDHVASLGPWGPVTVVGLMALAILVSPLPSAPIAVAAGAAYGQVWGTIYVLIGAELGAVAAFSVARFFGYDALHRWFGDKLSVGWIGSQNMLMGLVFVSRMIPFISFDLISYAAGLTVLSFWRFAVATAVGIVPASFLLAHFGGEMATGEPGRMMISVVALGAITLVPIVFAFVRNRTRKRD